MKSITYHIHLIEPVLVTSLAGDPNSGVAFPYLPGSVLRGVIIGAYMRQNKLKTLDDADEAVRRLFFDGQTQYLNGYLLDREDQRSLPTPLSWQQEKEKQRIESDELPTDVFDFAVEELEDDVNEPKQWKTAKKPFFSLTKTTEKVRWATPEKTLAVHTQRDPVMGRSTRDGGAIYQYEALTAGQRFAAIILCDTDADEETLATLLDGEFNLGGSRGAGYGRVCFKTVDVTSERKMLGALETEQDGRFIVTCLSDMIFQDEQGQFQADAELMKTALEKRIDCSLAWYSDEGSSIFMDSTYVGGFNRKWGLPLPQTKAIGMGSVLIFDPPACTIDQLQTAEVKGLGLRRAEGFGRIAFNWQSNEEWSVEGRVSPQISKPIPLSPGTPEGELVQTMVNRLFRQQLDAQLAVKANGLAKKLSVQNSQLSRLRQVVQDELRKRPFADSKSAPDQMKNGRERLIAYAQKLEKRSTTRKQFDRARINNKPMLAWLTERVNDDKEIESALQPAAVPTIGETKGNWMAVMHYEYNLRLIDMTLAYCLKKGKEEN